MNYTTLTFTITLSLLMATPTSPQPTQPVSGDRSTRIHSSKPHPKFNPTPALPPDSPVAPAVVATDAGDFEKAASLLSALDPGTMPGTEARRWRIYAQLNAVRTGNLSLLKRANQWGEGLEFANARQILHAWELAQVNEITQAKTVLKKVTDPEKLDERSRRRYLALLAGIAEMEKDRKSERIYLAKLVDYMGRWKSDTCQACHENPEKYGDDVTSLDVQNIWIGKRFSTVLAAEGDAAKIRTDATKHLAANPQDETARLRLAYALRAEGKNTQATQEMQKLEWAVFPDRPFKQPDNAITFPGEMPAKELRPAESFMPENHILSSADYLRAGEFSRSHQEIAELGPLEKLPHALRYKAHALQAQLARLENKPVAEKQALALLIDTVAQFPRDYVPDTNIVVGVRVAKNLPTPFDTWGEWWVTRRLITLGETTLAEKALRLPIFPPDFPGLRRRDIILLNP